MEKAKILDTKSLILCSLFASLTAVGAFIKIPVPFVPFTLQFFFTNMAGLLLLKKRGLISVGLYLVLGLAGLPIFTQGGGIGYIFQPTFGYLLGMALGTYVCGYICEKGRDTMKTYLIAGTVNLCIVYAFGVIYLQLIKGLYLGAPMSIGNLLFYCFLVFIPGDGASLVLGAFIKKRLNKATKG